MVEKEGNQGVRPRLDWGQVSVSPTGFPSGKNLFRAVNSSFRPLFTGQLFIVATGPSWHCTLKTHVGLRRCCGRHAAPAMVSAPDNRQGDADSTPDAGFMTESHLPNARARLAPAGLIFL